jgi:hypothetical protein
MTVAAVGYLFSPEMDIAIIKLALGFVVVLTFVVMAMAAVGMFSDPNYKPGLEEDEDEDDHDDPPKDLVDLSRW